MRCPFCGQTFSLFDRESEIYLCEHCLLLMFRLSVNSRMTGRFETFGLWRKIRKETGYGIFLHPHVH
jgi:hypothetical protein